MASSRRLRGVRDQDVDAPDLGWLTSKLLANRSAVARHQDDVDGVKYPEGSRLSNQHIQERK